MVDGVVDILWFVADSVTLTNVGDAEVAMGIAVRGVLDLVDDLEGVVTGATSRTVHAERAGGTCSEHKF